MSFVESAFSTAYKPTPLEQAYCLYILDVVLHVPREPFRLSGRLAVPFLNSSGLDRNLLRELWTIVDPTMEGSLIDLLQFKALLKLVSLAQHKCLDMAQYEGQLLYRQVPLPTFFTMVVMPSHQLLLELYPSVKANQVILSAPAVQLSVSDAFGDLAVDSPLPSFMPQSTTSAPALADENDEDFGDMQGVDGSMGDVDNEVECETSPEGQVVSQHDPVQDKFGDLPNPATPHTSISNPRQGECHGDHNDVECAQSEIILSHHPGMSEIQALHNVESIGGVGVGVLPGMSAPMTLTIESQHKPPYSLGVIEAAPNARFGELARVQNSVSETTGPVPYDDTFIPNESHVAYGPMTHAPLHTFDEVQGMQSNSIQNLGDDALLSREIDSSDLKDESFGSFAGIPPCINQAAATETTAFDGIQPIQSQPLPLLDPISTPSAVFDHHDDEDFGDFAGVPHSIDDSAVSKNDALCENNSVLNLPAPSLGDLSFPSASVHYHNSDGFVHFAGISHSIDNTAVPSDGPLGPLGEIETLQDKPLPTLEAISALPVAVDHHDDEDFGDFAGLPYSIDGHGLLKNEALGEFNPSLGDTSFLSASGHYHKGDGVDNFAGISHSMDNTVVAGACSLGESEPTQDKSLPSLEAISATSTAVHHEDDEDFGDFAGVSHSMDGMGVTKHDPVCDVDPFRNLPLQSLEATQDSSNNVHNHEDDGFRDFTGVPYSNDAANASTSGPLGEFEHIRNQPLQSLEAMSVRSATDHHYQDDRSRNFAGVLHSFNATEVPGGDPFDEIESVQEHSLPYPEPTFAPPGLQEHHDNDNFGDFARVSDSIEATPMSNGGPFGGIALFQDQPLPSLEAMSTSRVVVEHHDKGDSSGFAGFSSSPDAAHSSSGGPFGDMAPIQNQPLSSLAAISLPLVPDDHHYANEFGGIATTIDQAGVVGGDPFGQIAPIQNHQFPSLEAISVPSAIAGYNDDDDFGDFEGVPNACGASVLSSAGPFREPEPIKNQVFSSHEAASSPLDSVDHHHSDEFGDFTGVDEPIDDTGFPSYDPFGAVQPLQNQHLPSLEALSAPSASVDHDQFGDFAGVPHSFGDAGVLSGNPSQENNREEQPLPSVEAVSACSAFLNHNDDEDFGEFESVPHSIDVTGVPDHDERCEVQPMQNQPLPCSETTLAPPTVVQSRDNDDVGYLSAVSRTTGVISVDAIPARSLGLDLHDGDDFGVFAGVPHQEFPSGGPVGEISPIQNQPATAVDNCDDDGFGEFTGISSSVAPEGLPNGAPFGQIEPIRMQRLPSLEVASDPSAGVDHHEDEDFGDFACVSHPIDVTGVSIDPSGIQIMENEPHPTTLMPLSSHLPDNPQGDTKDDSFGDFVAFREPSAVSDGISLELFKGEHASTFSASAAQPQLATGQVHCNDDFGDFEGVKVFSGFEDAPLGPKAAQDVFHDPRESLSKQEQANDLTTGSADCRETSRSQPHEFSNCEALADPVSKAGGTNLVVDLNDNFGSLGDSQVVSQSIATTLPFDDVEDWDSFQDALPSKPFTPPTLDEIEDQLHQLSVSGCFESINFVGQLKTSLAATSHSTNNENSLQRGRRCLDVVSLLATTSSGLANGDWNRVFIAVTKEISLGLLLLHEAQKLPRTSKKEVAQHLTVMVTGLGEYVRVTRSIVASVGDVLCLDVNVPLSKDQLPTAWQSLDIAKLALEVEESWELVEAAANSLNLSISSRLETIQSIRKIALETKSNSLCQLTLQPVSHEESTKNEVIWEGKPFMACAANLWANRVSSTFPYSI